MELDDINPLWFVTAGVGFLIGVIMLKFGGLQGMTLIGKAGYLVGGTIGGFIAGMIFFRD